MSELEKNSRIDHLPPIITVPAFYRDTRLCPVFYLRSYLKRTQKIRQSDSLFITLVRPHKAAAKSTLRRFLAEALLKCGVSTTPGSTRSTSSSKARSAGASMSTILEAGDWAHAGVFKKHYYKAVPFDFQTSIFS
jgi:hypothetical protein